MKPELPPSDAFWALSSAYLDAGDSVLATIRTGSYTGLAVIPCVFLYFRSTELAIKSVLVHHGVPEREITRALGHRISELISRTETFIQLSDIGIDPSCRSLLDRFSDDYANKLFEYSDDWWNYPHLEDLQSIARRICDTVRIYLQKNAP
jgi:hypothetical protein